MAIKTIHPDELRFLGDRLEAAWDELWNRFAAPYTDLEREEALGSETLGAVDTLREIGERLIGFTIGDRRAER